MVDNLQKQLTSWASLEKVNVFIDQKQILSNLNINLNYDENTVILGPNGSGKSTFLKLLNRSIYPIVSNKSSFRLFNKENINIWDLRKKVGFLFKEMEDRVNKGVIVYELILSGFNGQYNARNSSLLSKNDLKKIKDLINELELEDIVNQDFHSLSDGQKRRALLARVFVYHPKFLVLDEPFCNLDIKSNYIINKLLIKLINKSVNIIYVTHSLESIIPQTNRVILIKKGTIIKDGKPDEVITSEILSDLFDISIKVIKHDNYWRTIPICD